MSTAVAIEQIVKSFGGTGAPAVDGVSLRVQPGELFFLLGPSGCGKTTLLRMIAGFTEPTSGRIAFETPAGTRDVTHLPPNKRNTGMVFQSYALWPHMSIAQNVAFGLEIRKVSKAEIDTRVREALALVQMERFIDRKPNQLSGGQQQRVALARALVVRPDVLLLDEPLSNLDAKLRVELRGEIRRICKASGITTVYVTHDQKEALSMADRVAILDAGHVVQIGSPGELYHAPGSRFVAEFLGETNFIPVQIDPANSGPGCTVITGCGPLRSARTLPTSAASGEVVASLRPESLRIVPDGQTASNGTLRGTVVETTYLGELAQLIIELSPLASSAAAPQRIKVAVLNPGPLVAARPAGTKVTLTVDPDDVVLVPAAQRTRTT